MTRQYQTLLLATGASAVLSYVHILGSVFALETHQEHAFVLLALGALLFFTCTLLLAHFTLEMWKFERHLPPPLPEHD